jgi:hypothetical protein
MQEKLYISPEFSGDFSNRHGFHSYTGAMWYVHASPSTCCAEQRLCRHESHFGRFTSTLRHNYDYSDPLQIAAAGVNVVTQFGGVDPLIRDVGRSLDRNTEPVPEFRGYLPRIRENTIGTLKDLANLRIFSAGAKLLNFLGDAAADGADLAAGVNHGRGAFRSRMAKLFKFR